MDTVVDFWSERRTVVAIAITILALAEIVDLTIVGVALPDIMGALGANINQVSLTMTSYIVAAAVFIPLTGIVSKKFGSKRVILVSALIFGISSILCGLSTNLEEMVIFRLIQGIGGAFLPSMAQSYIVDNFNKQEMPKIMTVYSLCLVMGPVIGPIFGGYIVQHLSWRWIFYVNVPICVLGFLLVSTLMEETKLDNVKIDYTSFMFMVIGVGCLEFFLDEGNQYNWFDSREMIIVFATGCLSILFFIWRGLWGKSVVNFAVFKDNNFILSSLLVFCFMVTAIIAMAYFPTLLQQGYGYPVDLAGYITAPRGLCAFIAAPIFIGLSKKIDPRYLMSLGLFLFFLSNLVLSSFGANSNQAIILFTVFLQGVGLTGTFITLLQCAFTKMSTELTNDASGVFNFFRNIGNSVGTSIAATLIAHQQQGAWHDMAANIALSNPRFVHFSQLLPTLPLNLKVQITALMIQGQAFLISNIDAVKVSTFLSLAIIWIPFALAKVDAAQAKEGPMLH